MLDITEIKIVKPAFPAIPKVLFREINFPKCTTFADYNSSQYHLSLLGLIQQYNISI